MSYTKNDLILLLNWYKTTDFNVEGHSSEDCVNQCLLEDGLEMPSNECDATEIDIY